jgi:hypothetical protein
MQYLQHAVFLNDEGLALLESGKQHEAFETFIGAVESISTLTRSLGANNRYCISLLQSSWRHKPCFASTTAPVHFFGCILYDEDFDYEQIPSLTNQQGSNNRNHGDPCHTSFHHLSVNQTEPHYNFVYNQAFRFHSPREMLLSENQCFHDEGTCAHYLKLYRAILTFNSALTFHQRSIGAEKSVKRTAEAVAADLYLDTMTLLHDCYSTLDSYRVLAATLNNAAVLFYEIQDFERFAWFQTELHLLLLDMESSFPKSVSSRRGKNLLFNATLLTPPRTAGAA